jgi:hypothetical protein
LTRDFHCKPLGAILDPFERTQPGIACAGKKYEEIWQKETGHGKKGSDWALPESHRPALRPGAPGRGRMR